MEMESQLKRGISRQLSTGSLGKSGKFSFRRNLSFDPKVSHVVRFSFGRQSSLDPNRRRRRRRDPTMEELTVPETLDATMQLLFLACQGDTKGLEDLLKEGVDVNSIDLDGRTALHIAACEGHTDIVKLLLCWKANIDARDRWGSTAAADAKYYGNVEIYKILKARGAKAPKIRRTPMSVSNPQEIPEYELSPKDLQFRRGEEILKGGYQVAKWNGIKVLVKVLEKECYSDPDSINAFKHELTLLEKVRHPNVVQFVGAVTQNIPMMIVSEYHPKGDLRSYLQKKGRLQPHKVLKYSLEIVRGMNYLHQCKPDSIIHCDLKPKNILLDIGGELKVTGFGLIRLLKIAPDKVKLAHSGTQIDKSSMYMAPEVYKNEIFDASVDVFSFGLIVYEMIEGTHAFHPKKYRRSCKDDLLRRKEAIIKAQMEKLPVRP